MKPSPTRLDRTFCNGKGCKLSSKCARWTRHYDWKGVTQNVSMIDSASCDDAESIRENGTPIFFEDIEQ